MNKQEFYDLCKNHDWYYDMSDDHRVWLRGEDSIKNLRYLAKNNEEFKEILRAFSSYHFTGIAFGTEQAPYPERPDD